MNTGRLALAALLGGLTLFAWGAVSHMVLPFANAALLPFTDEDAVTRAILENSPRSGIYFLPYMPERAGGMSEEEFRSRQGRAEAQMQSGPFVFASVRRGAMGSFGLYFVIQLVTDVLSALFVCLILWKVAGESFIGRVGVAVWVALAGFAAQTLPQWNWYAFSNAYTLSELFDTVVGFILAGMVIAKVQFGGTSEV